MTRKKKRSYEIPIETGDAAAAETRAAEAARAAAEDAAAAARGDAGHRESGPIPGGVAGEDSGPESPEQVLDHLRRLQAEFTNYRRRTDRERVEIGAYAQALLVEKLLPVLDDFDRAAGAADEDTAAHQGFVMIRDKLQRLLREAGLERIEVQGADFDPEVHEALMTQPVEPDLDGKVLNEIEPGYRFKGRMVRPARVQVGVRAED